MHALRAVPLRRLSRPAYPTKLAALANPDLLFRHQPRNWLASRELAAAAGFLLAAQTGCQQPGGSSGVQATNSAPPRKSHLDPNAPSIVAPLFLHGEGRGAAGCVVVNPPTILSEEEAYQVITEELSAAGLRDWTRRVVLPNVPINHMADLPAPVGEFSPFSAPVRRWPTPGPFVVDGLDPARHIAFEFASVRDYDTVGGPWQATDGSWSSVSSWDCRQLAGYVSDALRDKPTGLYVGVFYDPAPRWFENSDKTDAAGLLPTSRPSETESAYVERLISSRMRTKEAEAAAYERAREQLRLQVKDFIDWLKAQGAI